MARYREPYSYSRGHARERDYSYYQRPRDYYERSDSDSYSGYIDYGRPNSAYLFRNLIFAVLAGLDDNGEGRYRYVPYDSNGYSSPSIGYMNRDYEAAYSYAADPTSFDPYFYDDPSYAEVLPMQYFTDRQPGGELFRKIFTQLLAVGYDQGYMDGLAALESEEKDRVLYDPYAYENESLGPYSVSLGDNRRCLNEGYELGYQDAINKIDDYEQFDDQGVDLVSVILGTVSQLI